MVSVCTITEALNAYQSFCSVISRYASTEWIRQNQDSDLRILKSWIKEYKQNHHNHWWEAKSSDEIMSMLSVVPLNDVARAEVSELVNCIKMDR